MDDVVLQVSECVDLINQTLDYAYPTIVVEGEVSGFKINRDKFVFFDLKDENSNLSCFMMVFHLSVPLEDGMRVVIKAKPKLTKWSKLSLTVMQIQPVGEGSIKRNFELLKQKLHKEGLFDVSRKRELPRFPTRIGILSSIEAAGYADFQKIIANRWGGLEVIVADSQVQGLDAPSQLIAGLNLLNEQSLDEIAIVRGGGSLEDLQAFNDEGFVRAIAASRTPTIVGVGHEVDITLADLVADRRAATPSNAAEIVVPDRDEVLLQFQQTVSGIEEKIVQLIRSKRNLLERGFAIMSARTNIGAARENLVELQRGIEKSLARHINAQKQWLSNQARILQSLNPRRVLGLGYGLVRGQTGIISSASQLESGDRIVTELSDGVVESEVSNVQIN